MVDLYKKQLLNASKFVKVFSRDIPKEEEQLPPFSGRGHFQCPCDIPGMTQHGYYNTVIVMGFNEVHDKYDRMLSFVVNRMDGWWEDRTLDDDLKRYFCQQAPSFFKLGSFEEYYFTQPMIEGVRAYVRILDGSHVNDVVTLLDAIDTDVFNITDYDFRVYVWMSKMPGIYVDPMSWNPLYDRPRIGDVRSYNQSRFEECVYAYQILENQGDLGPVLTPLKEENSIEQEDSNSQINPTVPNDPPSVEEPTYDFSATSATWHSTDIFDSGPPLSSYFELGPNEPTI